MHRAARVGSRRSQPRSKELGTLNSRQTSQLPSVTGSSDFGEGLAPHSPTPPIRVVCLIGPWGGRIRLTGESTPVSPACFRHTHPGARTRCAGADLGTFFVGTWAVSWFFLSLLACLQVCTLHSAVIFFSRPTWEKQQQAPACYLPLRDGRIPGIRGQLLGLCVFFLGVEADHVLTMGSCASGCLPWVNLDR